MRIAALLVAAVPLPLFSADPPATVEDLFPLAVGNTWTYKVAGQDDRFTVRVVGQEMVGQQTCYVLEGRLKDKVVASEHLAFTKTGLTRFRVDKEDVVPPLTILRLPGSNRVRPPTKYQLGERSAFVTVRVSNGEEGTVPAGKFKTVVVSLELGVESGYRKTTVSYAAGVGIVKQTIADGNQRPYFTMELEKFEKGE